MAQALTLRLVQERIHAAQDELGREKLKIENATKRIEALHGEIGDLLAAGRVLQRLGARTVSSATDDQEPAFASVGDDFDPNENKGNPYRPSTNKAFMWRVLREADRPWLTANEIQEAATKLRGVGIPMSSVSPGLSEMKQDGTIERDGMKVALKSRLNENGALNGQAASAPEAGGAATPLNENSEGFRPQS